MININIAEKIRMFSKHLKKKVKKIKKKANQIGKKINLLIHRRKHEGIKENKNTEHSNPNRNRLPVKYFIFGMIFTLVFVLIPVQVVSWFRELPSPDNLSIETSKRNTRILDRNDKLLYEIYVERNFDPVKIDQIPQCIKDATISAEDASFYSHKGLNIRGIIRAAKETLFEDNLQGGSTITQQLVKNVLLTPERTLSRKIKEAVLALLIETKYSKDQILEMYLNNTPYGGTAWGIQPASKKYFGKNVWELSTAECALLAGLPSSPTTNSPLSNMEAAKSRQMYVLGKMLSLGFINESDYAIAKEEPLRIVNQTEYIRAPHFVQYVRKELEKRYGKREVELGGLIVKTTLDYDIHQKVQGIVSEEVNNNGSRFGFSNGAAVVVEPKTGGILAYVGSVDYFKEGWGSYDVVTALRQPGSSVKPITYSLALSGDYTLASIIEDAEVSFPQVDGKYYTPVNYDGKYHGKVTLRQALANSYNIPAVKIASVVGPDNIVSLGKELGLSNWIIGSGYGLSVTLGGKEVRLIDLTNVFSTYARGGNYMDINPFLSIKDGRGFEILEKDNEERRVISEEIAYLIWSVLSDNNARSPAFGTNSYLVVPGYNVAVKTGTTDNKKDNWTVGYTPSFAVGVWVGNNDGKPMNAYLASGLSGAAPIWNKIFRTILEGHKNEVMTPPDGIFLKREDSCSKSEYFIKGSNIPDSLCIPKDKDRDKDKKNKKD